MKVTDERLQELMSESWLSAEIIFALKELQSLRKIDIEHTLKYAEEAGAAIEELKHGVEEAIREINILLSQDGDQTDFVKGYDAGMRKVIKRIEKHVSKYLGD